MKTFFVVGISLLLNFTINKYPIYGTWELVKIEVGEKVLKAKKGRYTCVISEEMVSFNLEINRCKSFIKSLDDKELTAEGAMCTEICCDGRTDSISNYIDYSGLYEIVDNQLIFNTEKSKVYLKRVLE